MRQILFVLFLLQAFEAKQTTGTSASGVGVQIYVCSTGGSWTFEAPEATLYQGKAVVGKHGKGPQWTWNDGSSVTGKPAGTKPAPDPTHDIPWLWLDASDVPGKVGVLTGTVRVTRWDTEGGVAPSTGCDQEHLGQKVRVPYKATYSFLQASDLKP